MSNPRSVIGNTAKGGDFWDRHYEVQRIWDALETSSVLLKAPRRFGKTSVMFNLYEQPRNGFKVFYHDTEGLKGPDEFISKIMAAVMVEPTMSNMFWSAYGWVKSIAQRTDEIDIAGVRLKLRELLKDRWTIAATELISILSKYQGRILFLIDELPILIGRIAKAHGNEAANDFLHWFRDIRINPELSHIRWVVGGSIGIEHILNNIGSGTKVINDYQIVPIGAFNYEDGRNFIRARLNGIEKFKTTPDNIIARLMEVIGPPIPYFIQIMVDECINQAYLLEKDVIDEEVLKRAYNEGLLGATSRTYFEHYFTRLKEYYDIDTERMVKRLILEVARGEPIEKGALLKLFRTESRGKMPDEEFSYIMSDIENDFYVVYDAEKKSYSFMTKILRDWWLRYYDLVEE